MYNIKLMNKISEKGLKNFDDKYNYGEDIENPDALLVRSAKLHDYDFDKNTKAVVRAGAGVNNIPLDKCIEKGIVVFNTPGANANAVKELVISGLIMASRNLVQANRWVMDLPKDENIYTEVEKGKKKFAGNELIGKKIGVIGLGAIGINVANAALGLGMEVYGYDPFISIKNAWALNQQIERVTELEKLYEECDYISIHVPSNDSTKGFLNAESFSKMKDGVVVLNFARVNLVNADDLLKYLDEKVRVYVSDFVDLKLIDHPHTVFLPHLGASTSESETNCAKMAVRQVKSYLEDGNIENAISLPRVKQDRTAKYRLCIINKNIPNVLAFVSNILAKRDINIENMLNKGKGDYAYTIVDFNNKMTDEILEEIYSVPGIIKVRLLGE